MDKYNVHKVEYESAHLRDTYHSESDEKIIAEANPIISKIYLVNNPGNSEQ